MQHRNGSYKHVELPLSSVNQELLECPHCTGTRITLEGDFRRHFSEDFDQKCSDTLTLGDACKHVTHIICPACTTVFHLIEDHVLLEKQELIRLKQLHAQTQQISAPTIIIQ